MKSKYKHPTYFWSDWFMDAEIQGSLMIVMSCIKLLGKHTVGNDIPFVTAAGTGLGTTGVGAATGRMAGDLLVENDWTTNREKRRGGYKKYRNYFNEDNLSHRWQLYCRWLAQKQFPCNKNGKLLALYTDLQGRLFSISTRVTELFSSTVEMQAWSLTPESKNPIDLYSHKCLRYTPLLNFRNDQLFRSQWITWVLLSVPELVPGTMVTAQGQAVQGRSGH